MKAEEFKRVMEIAAEKYECDDIVFRVGLLKDAVEFERERCLKHVREMTGHAKEGGEEWATLCALQIVISGGQ